MKYSQTLNRSLIIITGAILLIGALAPCLFFLYTNIAHHAQNYLYQTCGITKAIVSFKNPPSPELQQKITSIVQKYAQSCTFFTCSKNDIQDLLNPFNTLIKTISYHITPQQIIVFTLEMAQPILVINDTFLLTDNAHVIPKEAFNPVPQLHSITMPHITSPSKVQPSLLTFLLTIPSFIWEHFNIAYIKTSHIILTPKYKNPLYTILTNELNFSQEEKYNALLPIYNDLIKQGIISKTKIKTHQNQLCFDMRFHNYVIVNHKNRSIKGGKSP